VAELWAPFADNLERWIDSIEKARVVRGFTSLEDEQHLIDTLARRDPAALPWQSAEDSPYPYGVAATVSIPERDIPRAIRTAVSHGLKFSLDMPWHVEPLGLREGAYEVPNVPNGKFSRDYLKHEARAAQMFGMTLDKLYGQLHYGDMAVAQASRKLNTRNTPIADQGKRFLRTMGKLASDNNYEYVDPNTGAVGRWGIRPRDWKAWSARALGEPIPLKKDEAGRTIPPNRKVQDRVATEMVNGLYELHKDWSKIADLWRAGKSTKADSSFRKVFRSAWANEAYYHGVKPQEGAVQ
jgi:hypothetical protein